MRPRYAVLRAVKAGHRHPGLIACITGLERDRVRTELRRLADKGEVVRIARGEYVVPVSPCALEAQWKGRAA